jgi:hypothetical protein
MDMSKKISEVFDIEPVPMDRATLPTIAEDDKDSNVSSDAELARTNIKGLLNLGNRAIESALEIAIQSETPRSYEVLATMLKTVSDMNSQLLDVHEKKRKILEKSPEKNQPTANVTNNVAFIGTTSEMNAIIMEKMKKHEII